MADGGAESIKRITEFILAQLDQKKALASKSVLVVGIQGPQGCGKSYLTEKVAAKLREEHQLAICTLSLDDLYLDHEGLTRVASTHPKNKMLQGRGQPGTHDLELAARSLEALKSINTSPSQQSVELPIFEKSLFNGQGDRLPATVSVSGPLDAVLFEGWMNGFTSLPPTELSSLYEAAQKDPAAYASQHLDYSQPTFLEHSLDNLLLINASLREYESKLWSYLDCFVQIKPVNMSFIWKWRLEQEHNMKAKNGGKGMSDAEVEAFIARYMPGYELFLGGLASSISPWSGRGLRLQLGEQRQVVGHDSF